MDPQKILGKYQKVNGNLMRQKMEIEVNCSLISVYFDGKQDVSRSRHVVWLQNRWLISVVELDMIDKLNMFWIYACPD